MKATSFTQAYLKKWEGSPSINDYDKYVTSFTFLWNQQIAFQSLLTPACFRVRVNAHNLQYLRDTHLRQVPDVVGIQEQLLQTPRIPQDILRHIRKRAMPLVNIFNLTIAFEQRYTPKHDENYTSNQLYSNLTHTRHIIEHLNYL